MGTFGLGALAVVAVASMPFRGFTEVDAANMLQGLREQSRVLESLRWWAGAGEAVAADDPMVFGEEDPGAPTVEDQKGAVHEGNPTSKDAEQAGTPGRPSEGKNAAAAAGTTWKGFRAAGDPTLDALRYEVCRAELQARLLKAQIEIRRAERDMRGIAERKEEKKEEKPVVILPPPRVKVLAMDPSGVIVEVDGVKLSFSRPGETKKGVEFVGVEGNRVIVKANGREGSGKF